MDKKQKQLHDKDIQRNTKKEGWRPPPRAESDSESDSDYGSQPNPGLSDLDAGFKAKGKEVVGKDLWKKQPILQ